MTDPVLAVSTAQGRFYSRPTDGKLVPSVTNVVGCLDKSTPLKYWAAKECATYASQNREKLATLNEQEAWQLVRNAPFQRRDDSPAAIGDIVHNWIDQYVKGSPPSHDEVMQSHQTARHMWTSFIKFRDYYQPEFISSEFTVWSDAYDYAGTADLHLRINGVDALVDTKTGNNIYGETAMQLAAIANADFILEPDGRQREIPKFQRYGILHIRPRSATLAPVEKIEEAFTCFKSLRVAFQWKCDHADSSIGFAPKIT